MSVGGTSLVDVPPIGRGGISTGSGGTSTGSGGASMDSGGSGPTKLRPGDVNWPEPSLCGDDSTELAGTWIGHYQGQDPTPESTLHLRVGGTEAELCGTFSESTPQPLPPITDPQAGYPPGYDSSKFLELVPSFSYSLIFDVRRGAQVWFSFNVAEPWREWCQLQTPYQSELGWSCARNLGVSQQGDTCRQVDETGNEFVISCQQLNLCNGIEPACACSARGCEADANAPRYELDLTFDGDEAQGTIEGNAVVLHRE